jgi:hypothetical protein
MVLGCPEALEDLVLQASLDFQAFQKDQLDLVLPLDLVVLEVPPVQKDQMVPPVPWDQFLLFYPVVPDLLYLPVDLKVLAVLDFQDHLYPQMVQTVQKIRWLLQVLVTRVDQ